MRAQQKILQKRGGKAQGGQSRPTQFGFKAKKASKRREPDPYLLQKMEYYNCPYMVKTTTTCFPENWNAQQRLQLPLSAIIQPFQNLEIPQYTDVEPLRCKKCKAFMNPFWEFQKNGEVAKCNLCNTLNKVDQRHYSPLNEDYLPINWEERPELTSGAFEIKVGEEFSNKPPSDPTYLFVVDVTPAAINSGVTHTALAGIQGLVQDKLLDGGENARVGIICFDSKIHLISLDSVSKKPRVMTMVGNFDTCPIPTYNLLFSSEDFVEDSQFDMISAIADCFDPDTKIGNSIPVKSLLLLSNILMKSSGGRVSIVLANDKNDWGDSLHFKNQGNPRNMFLPTNSFYSQSGSVLSVNQVSFNLFVFGMGKAHNVITLGGFQKSLCGDTFYYQEADTESLNRFNTEFWNCLSRPLSWEVGIRVRISQGWKKKTVANYHYKTSDLMGPGNVDDKYTFMINLEPDENKKMTTDNLAIQVSFLYTNSKRERMLRIINQTSTISGDFGQIYEGVDYLSVCHSLLRSHEPKIYSSSSFTDLQREFMTQAKAIYNQGTSVLGQESEVLSMLPLAILGCMKHPILNLGAFKTMSPVVDLHNTVRLNIGRNSYDEISTQIMPNLFAIHNLTPDLCNYDEEGVFAWPEMLGLNFDSIGDEDGIYVMDDGFKIIIHLNNAIAPANLQALFGVQELSEIELPIDENSMMTQEGGIGSQLRNLLWELRSKRPSSHSQLLISIVGTGSDEEEEFYYKMYEEKHTGYKNAVYHLSYNDFWSNLHSGPFSPNAMR